MMTQRALQLEYEEIQLLWEKMCRRLKEGSTEDEWKSLALQCGRGHELIAKLIQGIKPEPSRQEEDKKKIRDAQRWLDEKYASLDPDVQKKALTRYEARVDAYRANYGDDPELEWDIKKKEWIG